MKQGASVVEYVSDDNPNLVYEVELNDELTLSEMAGDDSIDDAADFYQEDLDQDFPSRSEDEERALRSKRFLEEMMGSGPMAVTASRKRPMENIDYNFKEDFHTVVEGQRRENQGDGDEVEEDEDDFYDYPQKEDVKRVRLVDPIPRQRQKPAIVDPENSLLSFLSILAVQLNRKFDDLVTSDGLPTPEVQGMLEIARTYIQKHSPLKNVQLKDLVYDNGQDSSVRTMVAELLVALLQKQSGGSAYGQRIVPQNGGSMVYYTSANHRLRKNNFQILLGFQQTLKRMYWRKNPRIAEIEKEIMGYKSLVRLGGKQANNLTEVIQAREFDRGLLMQSVPKVLVIGAA